MAPQLQAVDSPATDLTALADWMNSQDLGRDAITDVEPISGGTQNIMLRLRYGDRTYVLRRGPQTLRSQSNKVIAREMQVLEALSGTAVPHPQLIAGCTDVDVLGAVFYLMEPVDGYNASVDLAPAHTHDARVRREMGFAMIDALAALGEVDHESVGLADYGHANGFLERQVPRWMRELDDYRQLDGYPGPELRGIERVADWLTANRPRHWRPGILHGDYHIANVMFSRTTPEVRAIVDWEMSTIGDPLLDLGWLLATWPEEDGAHDLLESRLAAAGGLPTRSELVHRYTELSSRDLTAIDWYTVLACFKLAIILEGTHARACAGQAPVVVGDRLHRYALQLFDRAHTYLI
jgi:aminoglycoside phosphotransferase (APT) family kinase protein